MKGLTKIKYVSGVDDSGNRRTYDKYEVVINDNTINIPVVGSINPENEVRLCMILQDLIDKELGDERT